MHLHHITQFIESRNATRVGGRSFRDLPRISPSATIMPSPTMSSSESASKRKRVAMACNTCRQRSIYPLCNELTVETKVYGLETPLTAVRRTEANLYRV